MEPLAWVVLSALAMVSVAAARRAHRVTWLHRQLGPVIDAHANAASDLDDKTDVLRRALADQSMRLEAAAELVEVGAWHPARRLLDDVVAAVERGDTGRSVRYRLQRLQLMIGARLEEPGLDAALETWMLTHPHDLALSLERARYLLARRELSTLLAWLPDWVETHADLSAGHSILGRARLLNGDLEPARVHLERARRLRVDRGAHDDDDDDEQWLARNA